MVHRGTPGRDRLIDRGLGGPAQFNLNLNRDLSQGLAVCTSASTIRTGTSRTWRRKRTAASETGATARADDAARPATGPTSATAVGDVGGMGVAGSQANRSDGC